MLVFVLELNMFYIEEMLSYRIGTVKCFHWMSKPVKAIANLTLTKQLLEKKTKINLLVANQTRHNVNDCDQ